MTKSRNNWLASATLTCAGVGVFGACLLGLVLMRPAAAQAPVPADVSETDLSKMDERWLQLIRGEMPKPGFGPAQAQSPQTLNVLMSDRAVAGRANNGSTVFISHTRGITLVANSSIKPVFDGSSFFYAAQLPFVSNCSPSGCTDLQFAPGDVVQAAQAGSVISLTIPALTAQALAEADAIRGAASPSQTVSATWYSAADPNVSVTRIATATAAGNYEASLVGLADVRAKDTGFVLINAGANTTAAQQFIAPYLRAQVNGRQISGQILPNRVINIQITDAPTSTRYAYGYADANGWFNTSVSGDGTGLLKPGDVISAFIPTNPLSDTNGQFVSMTVEDITARASYSLSRVVGNTSANQRVVLEIGSGPLLDFSGYMGTYTPTQVLAITSSVTGQYTATVAFQAGDFGTANLSDANGHDSYARFMLPYARARMGQNVFNSNVYADLNPLIGQLEVFSHPLTITVQSKRGYLKDVRSATGNSATGYFYLNASYDNTFPFGVSLFAGGDVVTVSSQLGSHLVFKLPSLTAMADPVGDVVTGTAPPNSVVQVRLAYGNSAPYPIPIATPTPFDATPAPTQPPTQPPQPTSSPATATAIPTVAQSVAELVARPAAADYSPLNLIATAVAMADANGVFTATFAGVADITGQTVGEVEWVSPEGLVALQTFQSPNNCVPLPSLINLSRSFISVGQSGNCPPFEARLLDANDVVKGVSTLYGFYSGNPFQQAILPGDTLELIGGGQTQRIRIPQLSVKLDPTTDRVSGSGVSNTEVSVSLINVGDYAKYIFSGTHYFTTTIGDAGTFTRSLSGITEIAPGSLAQVSFGQLPNFVAEDAVPWLRVYLNQSSMDFALVDSSLITVTMQMTSARPITGFVSTFPGQYQAGLPDTVIAGNLITVRTSQRVISLTVPSLSAKLDVAQRTVVGKAPPLARLRVQVYSQFFGNAVQTVIPPVVAQNITATASGEFSVTFTNTAKLLPFATLFYIAPNSNEVALNFGSPRWSVSIGEAYVSAQSLPLPFGPVSATLRSASGLTKSVVTSYPGNDGGFSALFAAPVAGGDHIIVTSPAQPNDPQTFVVPSYNVIYNQTQGVVSGTLTPNAVVSVLLPLRFSQGGFFIAVRNAQTNAAGHFVLDTSDLPLFLGNRGQIVVTDAVGNTIHVAFTISGYQSFLPVIFR